MTTITEFAAAKVNLTLRVLGRRADGYHEIESLVAFAGVGDRIALRPSGDLKVEAAGPFADAIHGENLVASTLALLRRLEPRLELGRVTLEKQLPVAAGLGGGSADAAAVLRAVRRANAEISAAMDWSEIAARIGADVSVCLESRAAFMRGIGEVVEPLAGFPRVAAVLVNPGAPLSTAAVYQALGAPAAAGPGRGASPGPFVTAREIVTCLEGQANDLEVPAVRLLPLIGYVRAALATSTGCLLARMTGSGPTCFGLFESSATARAAADAIARARPTWWVQATWIG